MRPPTKCERDRLLEYWGMLDCRCPECRERNRRVMRQVAGPVEGWFVSMRNYLERYRREAADEGDQA